jgi:hypothetical protein
MEGIDMAPPFLPGCNPTDYARSMLPNRRHCSVGASACRHDDEIGASRDQFAQTCRRFPLIIEGNYSGEDGHPVFWL